MCVCVCVYVFDETCWLAFGGFVRTDKAPMGIVQISGVDDFTVSVAGGNNASRGSTFLRNLPCPVSFPRIPRTTGVVDCKEMRKTSLLDVYRTLEAGGFIIGAKDEKVAEYTLGKLQELTNNGCANGYPDFYYINGPVVVMTKVGDTYYWMYGNPISYIPETYGNFVNESKNWKLAQTAYQRAIKRLNGESPIFFYGH